MPTDSLRNVKDRFSEFVDRVEREHERIVVTRNGRPAAVLISPDDLDSLEETLDLLSDQVAIRELVEAQAAVASGDVVRGVDAVRSLRPTTVENLLASSVRDAGRNASCIESMISLEP